MIELDRVESAIGEAGFVPRGAFHPTPTDQVPDLAPGTPSGTLVLAGNAGPSMWEAFSAARDPHRDLLDDWSRAALGAVAERLGAIARYPFDRPPLPFQRWALRAEPCHVSPLGILIHPRYGLWHGFRGALLFADRLRLPPREALPSPCERCSDRPCLSTCPVGAFAPGRYDVPSCTGHIATPAGEDCLGEGCRARRACPVGREYRYAAAQARFHMTHFLRTSGVRQ